MGIIAAGVLAAGAGAYLSANAASKRQNFTQYIADTPQTDFGNVYNDTLGAMQGANPQAEALAGQQNTFNQAEVDRLIEQSIPGYKAGQKQRTDNALAELRGEIPADVSSAVARHGAAGAMEGGYAGSGASRALVARDLGMTSLDLTRQGGQDFAGIIGTTPMAQRVTSGSFLNIDPKTGLAIRDNERTQKMNILLKKAALKGANETYGEALSSVGGALTSYGMKK